MPRYRVTGPHKVAGYETGEEFEHTFPEVQEQRLLDAGHLERLDEDAGFGHTTADAEFDD